MSEYKGKYNAQYKTSDAAYNDGYETGRNWEAPWTPGGPFVHNVWDDGHERDWVAFCAHTRACNASWLQGWNDAMVAKAKGEVK